MAYDLLWNARMLGALKEHACLTEEEEIILDDWAKGRSIANTATMRNMSTSKVDKLRRRIRLKYDDVQPYANLPARKR